MAEIKLNVLAADLENAKEIVAATDGQVYIGLMVKNFSSAQAAAEVVLAWQAAGIPVSVGLGDGDPAVWKQVAYTAMLTKPVHVNQVYSGAGYTLGALQAIGSANTIVNALVRPSGMPGKVSILTGPESQHFHEFISCEAAAAALKEIGIPSVKFYPVGGDQHLDEIAAMVKAAVGAGITMFEPTGGIGADSVEAVVRTCLENGAKLVVPHVYTAFVDKKTNKTEPLQVKKTLDLLAGIL